MAVATLTSGTGLLWSLRLGSHTPDGHALVFGLQVASLLLTLATFVLCLTMFWFNHPRFLAPTRYRKAIGRWQERKQEKERERRS
jgi:hypothetical protein